MRGPFAVGARLAALSPCIAGLLASTILIGIVIPAGGMEPEGTRRDQEIRIGYFGPSDPSHPLAGDMWRAAEMAIQEANKTGGDNQRPFRLVPAWSENPWGTGIKQVTDLVYAENVWAIVGGIDGPSTHLAEQVVAKARLALVSPVSTDKSINLAYVPWMFSVAPPDHRQVPPLAAEIQRRVQGGRFVTLSADDHDSHFFAEDLRKALSNLDLGASFQYEFHHGRPDVPALVQHVLAAHPTVVVVSAGVDDSACVIRALRQGGYSGEIFGRSVLAHRQFRVQSGAAANGVIFPLLDPPAANSDTFSAEFQSACGHVPDYTALYTYDAVRLLIAAIQSSGLDRSRIRDRLAEMPPWQGVSGPIHWDTHGANQRTTPLGTIEDAVVLPVR